MGGLGGIKLLSFWLPESCEGTLNSTKSFQSGAEGFGAFISVLCNITDAAELVGGKTGMKKKGFIKIVESSRQLQIGHFKNSETEANKAGTILRSQHKCGIGNPHDYQWECEVILIFNHKTDKAIIISIRKTQ